MITTPLSPVVAYLTRKGVSLDVLEGAPILIGIAGYRGNMVAFDAEKHGDWHGPGDLLLYLGRSNVCPAAMGWAAALLSLAVGDDDGCWIIVSEERVVLFDVSSDPSFCWFWRASRHGSAAARWMPGEPPLTPAERLKAVLEYEMGRQ